MSENVNVNVKANQNDGVGNINAVEIQLSQSKSTPHEAIKGENGKTQSSEGKIDEKVHQVADSLPKTMSQPNPLSNNPLRFIAQKKTPQAYWIVIQKSLQNASQNIPKSQSSSNNQPLSSPRQPSFQKISSILEYISDQYATFRFFDLSKQAIQLTQQKISQIQNQMQQQFKKYKLTKRTLIFSILLPEINLQNKSENIKSLIEKSKYYSKMINFYEGVTSSASLIEVPVVLTNKEKSRQESEESSLSPPSSPMKKQSNKVYSTDEIKQLSPPKQLQSNKSCMKLSRKSSVILGNQIFISINNTEDSIMKQLIRQMKLDFIWLGVLARLGTDVEKFQQEIVEEEDFTLAKVGFYDSFFDELNQLVKQYSLIHKQGLKQTTQRKQQVQQLPLIKYLEIANQKAILKNQQISSNAEEWIRQKFNSRLLINDIVSTGDYLKLLFSRNYFNLLYIQANTLIRFKQFKQNQCRSINKNWSSLYEILSLQNFLLIDDYFFNKQWYRNYILKCLPNVKFIIDRGDQSIPYSEIISKNYKQIIPPYRPTFDEYFISICNVLKERSQCLKQAVGSIIVQNKRIVATGYNGTPLDCLNCFNGGCKICNNSERMETEVLSCTCIHAEYGCILEAGIKVTPGSTLYSTKLPCLWCCKLIIQGRIKKIVYLKSQYPHLQYQNIAVAKDILNLAKIQLVQMDQSKVQISSS